MTGADTPSITVRQYGDAASIRSLIIRQPDNTEFLLCWKGKYIVGITHVPAEQHFNVRYEYDNGAVIAHDFFADSPYPGVLTIEASESSDPTPVADFETELRAFLQTVAVSNVALSRVARLDWWNTKAAYYLPDSLILTNVGGVGMDAWLLFANVNDSAVILFNGRCVRVTKTSSTTCVIDLFNDCGSGYLSLFNYSSQVDEYDVSLPYICQNEGDVDEMFDAIVGDFTGGLHESSSEFTASKGVVDGTIDFLAMQFGWEF